MKVLIAVFICKILYFIGRQVGKGSSLPGKVVLKIFPDILERLKLPDTIIAVTGSNGKTTTTELIVHALKADGLTVGWNHEGSNQTEGIATLLLRISSFTGKVKCDAVVMECDERYAKKIFEKVKPSALLVTNLCRDQLTRNGHPEFIEDCIRESLEVAGDGVKLILNADDPYVAALAYPLFTSPPEVSEGSEMERDDIIWFGVVFSDEFDDGNLQRPGMYDDGAFCPVCKSRMKYAYRIAGHYGSYSCAFCGLKRNDPVVEAVVSNDGCLVFNDGPGMNVVIPGITSAYNFCAAVATAKAAGIGMEESIRALDGYELTSGRVLPLVIGERRGLLLLSKHENSFAYDRSLSWIVDQKKPCTVVVLVNAISRKYYTTETSWLWDIDFDLLADGNIKNVVLAGHYVNELAMRFEMSAVDKMKIGYVEDLFELRQYIEGHTAGDIYIVTCFSDKVKLLKAIE